MKVRLVGYTQPAEDFKSDFNNAKELVAFCARVSNPSNQFNNETADKLIRYLIKYQHWSPLEMASATLEVETTRDIARQMLRHRSFSFQEFCIAGDSLVTTIKKDGSSRKVKIEDLYKRYKSHYWGMSDNLVKVYNEDTGLLEVAKIKEVFETGVKPVFQITLSNGKKVKSTLEHKLLTKGGFKQLKDIQVGDFIGCNGVPVWQDKDWLFKAKEESLLFGGLQYISEKAGTTTHTIRKWLKRHGLQFSKKEVASYTETWNKGLPKECQPMFGKFVDEDTRQKMRDSSKKGVENNLYKNGSNSYNTISFEKKCRQFSRGYVKELLVKQNFKCAITGVPVSIENAEVDHILPVFSYPEKAFDSTNLQVLSKEAHLEKSMKENVLSKKTVRYSPVVSIEYIGDEQTYDMEVMHISHNYVANGIVTHNSQRYANPIEDLKFELREARLQDTKNRQNSIEFDSEDEEQRFVAAEWNRRQQDVIDLVKENYSWALKAGIAKEQARAILPEGNIMSRMYVNGTIRSWVHYIQVRTDVSTQKEHRELALAIAKVIAKVFPFDVN